MNQPGSRRLRRYHIARLIWQAHLPAVAHGRIYADVTREVAAFDASMAALKAGDPARPMFLPRDAAIQRQFADLQKRWSQDMKQALAALIASPDANARDACVVA